MYHTGGGLNFRRPLQNGEILEIISSAGGGWGVFDGHWTLLLDAYYKSLVVNIQSVCGVELE